MTTGPDKPKPHDDPTNRPTQQSRLRRWRDYVEDQITEAAERGEFDNLRGSGQPLRLEKNVYAGDKALAYSLLKNNQLVPPEIERTKEIDADLARAEALLASLRHRRDTLESRHGRAFASDRRAYNLVREKSEVSYRDALRAINSNILSLNITAPPPMHRRMLDIEARLSAFRSEFPPLPE
jgi:DnaJ family protein C protein 28